MKASELIPNAQNWRRHPATQQSALMGALNEIGYADALIAYESTEGLVLIDGHLRASTTPDTLVPVLITDLSEHEANKLMATLDPLAAMAETDYEQLKQLRNTITFQDEKLKEVVDKLLLGDMLFLERALQADEDGLPFPKFESNSENDDLYGDDEDWMTFSIRVTPEQRSLIMGAVNVNKHLYGSETTTDALTDICKYYSRTLER